MIIARVHLTGFKSFATKTTLEFQAGITAVVGPNGSGKSNLADAIRWVLGEQSKGKLRLEEREEVIFAGSQTKAKASFAEIAIVFDNSDGAFPLDVTEVEISRRLYRSGESEYRLVGKSVRFGDVQALLAQSGISPGGYSVIGQGMIDSLLLSSPADRKLLFDEASGIRAPEMSRDAAVKKLVATTANLVRLRDIAAELEPRLSSLERVVATADQQAELSGHIQELRQQLVAQRMQVAHTTKADAELTIAATTAQLSQLEQDQATLLDRLNALRQARQAHEAEQALVNAALTRLQQSQQAAITEYTAHQTELTAVSVEAESAAEHLELSSRLQARRSAAAERSAELEAELAANTTSLERAAKAVERASKDVQAAQQALVALRDEHSDGTRDQYLTHALDILKVLATGLGDQSLASNDVKLLVHKAGRLLSHAARRGAQELVSELQAAQARLESAMSKREIAVEHQTNITITRRSLEIDIAHQDQLLAELDDDIAGQQSKIKLGQTAATRREALRTACQADQARLDDLEAQLTELRAQTAQQPDAARDIDAETETATALERCRAAQATVADAHQAAQETLEQAHSAEAAACELAASWDLDAYAIAQAHTASTPTDMTESQLATELAAAQATLAARANTQADQLEEYQEVKARHAELTGQIGDLEQAQADIEEVIGRLDMVIKSRFAENMQALATQFAQYFERLFAGGTASLILEEGQDGAYGIQIKASPGGKRLTNLTALSGGERTLTGVALLAAILRVNPSPFIVLDEVDAALDEANSGRLADILAELAQHSQLIVITHNRQTMQAAQMLYGVTLSAGHASHVLPLRLEEATAIAAR